MTADQRTKLVQEKRKSANAQMIAAILLLALFVAFLIYLIVNRDDEQWDRLMTLLGIFEAIVTAAVGFLFGSATEQKATATVIESIT